MYNQIYKVIFEDDTEFIGGSLDAPKWSKCPDNTIKALEINLPYGDKIVLSEYEQFNFFIGAIKSLNAGRLVISHLFALGCKNDLVTSYRITLTSRNASNKYQVGDMTVRQFAFGKEGIGKTSTTGWRKGTKVD